jgi:putative phosphoesterase
MSLISSNAFPQTINNPYVDNNPILKEPVQKLLATGFTRIVNYRFEEVQLDVESIYYNILENIPPGESTKKYALVIADTHNDYRYVQAIIEVANRLGIQNMFHAGDIVNEQCLTEFHNFRGKFAVSYGNHDKTFTKKRELNRLCNKYKFTHRCDYVKLNTNHKSIVLTHGNDTKLLNELIYDHDFDFLIVGHYHRRLLLHNQITNKYVINPGGFNHNPLPSVPIYNIPSFVLLPLNVNNPHDIIFYHIIQQKNHWKKKSKNKGPKTNKEEEHRIC